MAKKSKDDIKAIISHEMRVAQGYLGDPISERRALALHYYEGEPFGDEIQGRSQVVSRDVLETIEWMMPGLMRMFASGEKLGTFTPRGPEDEGMCDQATDYINYVFWHDNDGFRLLYNWFKDALLMKNGVVTWYQDDHTYSETNKYSDLGEEELIFLAQNENVKIQEASQKFVDGMALWDATIKVEMPEGRLKIVGVPSEEFLIAQFARSIHDTQRIGGVGHRTLMSKSSLIEEGYDKKKIMDLPDSAPEVYEGIESYERFDYDLYPNAQDSLEDSMRRVWVTDWYQRIDIDGDGIAERMKFKVAGLPDQIEIIDQEPYDDDPPYADLSPILMPHRYVGISVADLTMDLQRIKSALWRQSLDSMYLSNNPRSVVDVTKSVNMDDLLTTRPGGVIRTRDVNAVREIFPAFDPSRSISMMEYADKVRETRTGVNDLGVGVDPDVLQNQSATAVNQASSAAQSRLELIGRIFAETGVRDLFMGMLKHLHKHQNKSRIIRLKNKWVPMDPRYWNANMDCAVNVGLGSGNNDQKMVHLNLMLQKQEALLGTIGPDQQPLVGWEEYHNLLKEMGETVQLKNIERFFKDPSNQEQKPQEQKQDPEMAKVQAELQLEQQKAQAQIQLEQQKAQVKAQLEQQKAQQDAQLKQAEKQADVQLSREKAQAEIQAAREKTALEMQNEREKAALKLELERQKTAAQLKLKEEELEAEIRLEGIRVKNELDSANANVPGAT